MTATPGTWPEGYTDLAPGKLAAVVTYLEMRQAPATAPSAPSGWALDALGADVPRYRRLYAAVGEPWLWTSRRLIGDDALAAILADPRIEAFAVVEADRDVGIVELDFRGEDAELAFFGLVPDRVGRGLGRAVMVHALARAWSRPIRRLVIHTCTLDHPGAVGFYRACGFAPYKRAIEVLDDPRLTGVVPRDSAPLHPVID